jgi:hypothetical protein
MFQPGAMLYTGCGFGSRPENVEVPIIQTRAPASSDISVVGKRWVDSIGNATYELTSLSSLGGTLAANWVATSSGSSAVNTISGDSGTATPSAGNIEISGGSTGLVFTGSGSTVTESGTLNVAHGGTGIATTVPYALIAAGTTATGAFQQVSGLGTSGQVLTSNGAGALPTWQSLSGTGTVTSVSVVTANGFAGSVANPTTTPAITISTSQTGVLVGDGTAISGVTGANDGVLITNNSGVVSWLANSGTPGFILTANSAAPPSWQAAPASSISITGDTGGALTGAAFTFTGGSTGLTFAGSGSTETLGGTLVVANGGTGIATVGSDTYSVICGGTTATGVFQTVSGNGTSGQVLTSNGAGALPTWQAAGGGGITTINGNSGSVTGSTVTITTNGVFNAGASTSFTCSGTTMTLNLTNGSSSTFLGELCGHTGASCVGLGWTTLPNVSGSNNTAVGYNAANALTGGSGNTCVGYTCLSNITGGTSNCMFGGNAGNSYTGNDSNNISIGVGATGPSGTSNRLDIGAGTGVSTGFLNSAYICGIYGITTASATTSTVLVSDGNQLGTVASSRRFKRDIEDMGDVSSKIMKMRPVTFHYKAHKDNVLQYGLIAEEVMEIMPEIVNLDEEGVPMTVRYHDMPMMMLNEMQKMKKEIEELKKLLKK